MVGRGAGATGDGPLSGGWAPLTEAQWGLWFAQRLDPGNPIFNTGQYIDLRGPLDVDAFRSAVEQAMDEAQALSVRFDDGADGSRQAVDPGRRVCLEIVDLSSCSEPAAEALSLMRRDMETPLDLLRDPLALQRLFVLAPDRHLWLQRVHHLATDGYGMVLLTNRVAELYGAADAGRPFPPLQQVWTEDEAYKASEKRAADADFWREALKGAPEVVGLAPGRAMTAHRFHRSERMFDAGAAGRLLAVAQTLNVSWPDVLTALVAAYVRRFTATPEVVVGVPYMGRLGSAAARVPAMVMNVLPLRIAPDEDAPLADYVVGVSKALIKARRHGRYRSEQLRRDLGLLGGHRRLYGPLINVLPFDQPPRFEGLETRMHVLGTGPVDDINFTFRGDGAQSLTLEIDANPELYSAAEAAAHGERLAAFLDAAVSALRLGDVPTATPEEARREVEDFNATRHPVPDTTLTALIEATMVEGRDRTALVFEGRALTYGELDRLSAALAEALAARGAGPDGVVAVALPRSIELAVALVAVLRAGAAYLPIDLDHPDQRIAAILMASGARTVLAAGDERGLFGDRLLAVANWPKDGEAPAGPAPGDPAYVIYTSGSTGEPKGVVIEHRAIVNRLLWMQAQYGVTEASRILQKTPATFDVSVWEFFLPLISGGTLVVAPPGAHRDPAAIAALIREQGITDCHFVPSMLSVFLADPASRGLRLDRVYCSGEELPADLRDRFHRTLSAELHNLYGPTEAAVDVSYWPADEDDHARPVPIGRPVWNTRLLVLDERMRPVPPGMPGRLYIGGVQLSRGYLGRPDLTAERYLADPFTPGERLYDTGDVARRRADGAIVFLGRADHQVKVRGLRIELGEIEAAIAASGLTEAAAVLAREDRAGDRRLVAYVVPGAGYDRRTLRDRVAARLPDYMIPSAFVALDALPTTANGKLDRAALPAPAAEEGAGRAARDGTEAAVAALYAEVLGLERPVGAEEDFFALGGDSLLAVRLMLRVRERFGHDPGLGALFERPRVCDLAGLIDADAPEFDSGLGPLIKLADGDEALPPLFVVHPAGGITWGYRTLARALSPRRPVYGVQAPTLDPDAPAPDSIESLAAGYVDRLLAMRPHGPWHLMGWSVGGIIAQAMAVRLSELGQQVGLMAMLDSYPSECWRAEPEPTETAALRSLLSIAGYDPEDYPELVTREAIVGFLREGDSPLGGLPQKALDGVIRVVLDTNRLVRGHYHRPFPGVTTHVRASIDHVGKPLTPELWRPYAATLEVVDAPFLHPQLTGAAATALIAPALDARMAAVEEKA